MPRLPAVQTAALRDLEAQLRFAPVEALVRDIERAEALAADIEDEQAYPMAWVIFRITGYRPDGADDVVRGSALLEDLSALVERLCAAAGIRAESLEGQSFLSIEELASRWGVSRSTINRHRKRGLVARRVRASDGKDRLVFSAATVERHEQTHASALGRAGAYSRIDSAIKAEMLEAAAAFAAEGASLNEAAAHIAKRFERSHEAVRQVLRRGEQRRPLFGDQGRLGARERRFAARAAVRAIEPSQIAERLGCSDEAVRRAIEGERGSALRKLDRSGALEAPERIAARVDDDAWMKKTLEPAASDLAGSIPTDLLELLSWVRNESLRRSSQARLTAHQALRARAGRTIRSLASSSPSGSAMDRAETDIRWIVLLKTRIVRSHLGDVVAAAEEALGAPLDQMREREARDAVRAGIAAASVVIDAHDPARGSPLAAPLALGVSSAIGRASRDASGRARPRVASGVDLSPLAPLVAPRLVGWLPSPSLAQGAALLDEADRELLEERFGLRGPPSTLEEIASRRGVKPMHVARRLRRAQREALAAVR